MPLYPAALGIRVGEKPLNRNMQRQGLSYHHKFGKMTQKFAGYL